jgi:ubiquinone/menaquinone biosynthesis C-methylase UbiE
VPHDTYQQWARSFHGHAFLRRSAERNAGFLLPHLAPGQRLLDVGCGPGAITDGLAERVAPGEVVGVDADAAWVAAATERWARPNLRFVEGDAAALPFHDDAFDVAFLHAVLQHVSSPIDAIREVRRVVRPGGRVAVADADLDGFLVHPCPPGLDEAMALDRRTRRNPEVGRQLSALLRAGGFTDVEFTVSANVVSGAAVAGAAAAASTRLTASPFVRHAEAQGWATADALERMAGAWAEWSAAPGAVFVTLWCQALAT